ncbi:MAG: alpha/beta fold hydrolase [Planctomycetes bacterium]|nr:alpha/beta fold hydrolase [Planctomycetota bacterium]
MRGICITALITLLAGGGCFDPGDFINDFVFGPNGDDDCGALAAELEDEPESVPNDPSDLGLAFESFEVQASTGEPVAGWFIPAVGAARGTVLMNNASLGTRSCHLAWTSWLADAGYNVVMYDYEGFGASGGVKRITSIVPDAEAVLAWTLESDDPSRQSVALMGLSLGTGPSLRLAAEFPDQVWAVVLDSPYRVPDALNAPDLGLILELFIPEILRAFPTEMDSVASAANVSAPLLILSGSHDRALPAASEILQNLASGGEFVLFENSGHAQAVFDEPDRYQGEVLTFLDESSSSGK